MARVVPLNNVDHAGLRVHPGRGARWGEAVNRVPVFPSEFEAVQREYPILIGADEAGAPRAYALLGLDADENLFLDGDRWDARYVPALVERGPFSIGLVPREDGAREPMIHLDLDDPRVGHPDGAPLFLPHGGNAPYLDRVADTLRRIHLGHEAQAPMFAALAAAGLVEPTRLEISLDDTLRYDLVDFRTVGAAALAGLDGAALDDLHRRGFLAGAFQIASSLGNVADLIRRKNARRAAPAISA